MISPLLIDRLHEAASIHRWNDFAKPVDFTELDKQAHKMVIAYVLAKLEEERQAVDWLKLIDGAIFEFLHRIILTDIKPPVFHRMMREKGSELNRWVLQRLAPEFEGLPSTMIDNFRRYLCEPDYAAVERRILLAAHYLASQWEFNIIYRSCPFLYGIEAVRQEIEAQLGEHAALAGIAAIAPGQPLRDFLDLCGQLRFQRRWADTPRLPATSVLGHMLLVAVLSYLNVLDLGPNPRRARNAFLGGLFHDLPETLTRDISSPVKNAVEGLDELIKEYERREMEEKLLPLLPLAWHDEIRLFTEQEFVNRISVGGQLRVGLTAEQLAVACGDRDLGAVDGEMIRACDHLAACCEVSLSIRHGITSRTLKRALAKLVDRYSGCSVHGVPIGRLFRAVAAGDHG